MERKGKERKGKKVKGKERKGKRVMKGKNGGGRGLNRVDYHLGSSMDTCKLCFLLFIYIYVFFKFPSLQPCLEVSPLFVLVGATETRRVCMCACVCVSMHVSSTATSLAWSHEVNPGGFHQFWLREGCLGQTSAVCVGAAGP